MALMVERGRGNPVDGAAYDREVRAAVKAIVDKQFDLGIDVIDDGEQSKVGFVAYVNERLDGFSTGISYDPVFAGSKEYLAFPEFYAQYEGPGRSAPHLTCTAPITYKGAAQVRRDIENLRAAIGNRDPAGVFVPAASPGSIEGFQKNAYYPDAQSYLFAIADAMREEYRAIVAAGFIVQIDDPWLAMHYILDPNADVRSTYEWAELRIAALNRALEGIPPAMVRHHTCYGINMGPRATDFEMQYVVPLLFKINAGGYSFEAGNPRHEHEWQIWEGVDIPDGKYLIPGVVTHCSVLVEHPELVAQRIRRFADVAGAERIVAGTDCGFASNPGNVPEVHPTIVWAKLQSLVEGARLAGERLGARA